MKSMNLVESLKRRTSKLNFTSLLLLASLSSNLTLSFAISPANADEQHQQELFNKQRQIFDQLSNQKQLHQLTNLVQRLAPQSDQQQQQQLRDSSRDESGQQHLMVAHQSLAQLLQQSQPQDQQQDQQRSFWTSDGQPVDQFSANYQANAQQFVPYRQPTFIKPTLPSINRQLIAPPQFYDMNLVPVSALQIEQNNDEPRDNFVMGRTSPRAGSARSLMSGGSSSSNQSGEPTTNKKSSDSSAANRSNSQQQTSQHDNNSKDPISAEASNVSSSAKNPDDNADGNKNNSQQESSEMLVDKTIEPRQKRRIFNRILKKAEWNHLFVELSKVFLRYFLDLALKDIIGKQSGGDSTTSRKKLDAQSELTDLLKDFVKTAISNI